MKNFKQIVCALFMVATAGPAVAQVDVLDRVNPIIGTNGMGHTFPGACVPFGLVQLSPDTDTIPHNVDGKYQPRSYEYCAGYQYKDSSIVGFSHTHFSGTGHSDLGDILLMPVTGALKLNPGTATDPDGGYRSRFSHTTEVARPGYYEVLLSDYGIKAQLTTTKRVGVHKYTYPKESREQRVILDMIHGIYNYDGKVLWTNIRVENDTLVTGYRITNGWARENYTYFAISFSQPIVHYGCEEKAKVNYRGGYGKFNMKENFPDIGGRKIVMYFDFDPSRSKEVEVKVALSGVSTEGALKNLRAEASGRSFDQLATQASADWQKELSVIEAEGNDDQLSMLYTSLYHTMINPCVYTDVDGQYRGIDQNIHKAEGFDNYTVFSVWDTYRALHPLFNIIHRQVNTDIARSMLKHCEQSVHKALPVWSHMANENWCMIGYHSVSVLADAVAKGLPLEKKEVIEAMVSSSTIPYYDGTKEYMEKGYVPLDRNGSAGSLTLEYAYDDWTIYQTARRAGDKRTADRYEKRAQNYKNVFHPTIGYACPRYADGRWKENFNLLSTHGEGFIEGNALNYSFYVPQDVDGMIRLMGGEKAFTAKLDSLFTMHLPDEFFAETEDVTKEGLLGGYVHGNEPSHHIPFLYAWTSQPWKTQYWQREIMNRMYRNNIDGLCGNDDCGQMSAWYILSAMGFYPVCPGTDQYVLGAPYLPSMKVRLENGKTFVVKADRVSDENRYVKSVKLNGKPYLKGYITQADIMNGGELVFEMTSKPVKSRLFKGENRPYSLTADLENSAQKRGDKTLRLMSYNIRNGRGMDNVLDLNRISEVINRVEPMVVAVQEVDSVTGRSGQTDVLRVLAGQTGMYPTYSAAIDFDGGKYGVGILSREKPITSHSFPLPGREEQRTLLVVEFKDYLFACTHLSLTEEDCVASLPIIQAEAQRTKKPFFLAGDWNAQPDSKLLQEVRKSFDILTDTKQMTWPADMPRDCIDYIAGYRAGGKSVCLKLSSIVYDEPVASDHRPVLVEVKLK